MTVPDPTRFAGMHAERAGLVLDGELHRLKFLGRWAHLTGQEVVTMHMLMTRPVVSRAAWAMLTGSADITGKTIDVRMTFLRRHLKSLNAPFTIKAIHGTGYRLIHDQAQVEVATQEANQFGARDKFGRLLVCATCGQSWRQVDLQKMGKLTCCDDRRMVAVVLILAALQNAHRRTFEVSESITAAIQTVEEKEQWEPK